MSTPNPKNPSTLPQRYQIRRLGPEHIDWADAIVVHSNLFHSSVWTLVHPEDKTARYNRGIDAGRYLIAHQINSGMSFGVFDTEYVFKRPESATYPGGGRLWLEDSNLSVEATEGLEAESKRLLNGMDFPLVSVALSYDGIDPLDYAQLADLIEVLPAFPISYHVLEERDLRDPWNWKPTGPKQILMRNATSTRRDYEGRGLMGSLARWLMREASLEGYRGIQIECFNDAVTGVWMRPEKAIAEVDESEGKQFKGKRFRGEMISSFDSDSTTVEGEYVFRPSKQVVSKVFAVLRQHTDEEKKQADEGREKANMEKE